MIPEATIVIKLSHLYNYWARKSKTHLKPNHQLKCLNANKGIVFNASNHNKDTIFVVFFQFSNVHSKMPLDLRVQMFKCQRANTTKGLLTLQSCFTPPLNVSVSKSDISHLLPRLPLLIPLLIFVFFNWYSRKKSEDIYVQVSSRSQRKSIQLILDEN